MKKRTEELETAFMRGRLPEQGGKRPRLSRYCGCVTWKRDEPQAEVGCENCHGRGIIYDDDARRDSAVDRLR